MNTVPEIKNNELIIHVKHNEKVFFIQSHIDCVEDCIIYLRRHVEKINDKKTKGNR